MMPVCYLSRPVALDDTTALSTSVMVVLAASMLIGVGCGGAQVGKGASEPQSITMDALVVTPDGVYDAEDLFDHAYQLGKQNRCEEGIPYYEKVADEFADTQWASPALYNAGLCLHELSKGEAAAEFYERLLREHPGSEDTLHTRFQLAALYVSLERHERGLEIAKELLEIRDLDSDQKIEALARRSQHELGLGMIPEARRTARNAVGYYRSRPDNERVMDEFFAAAANYVFAETYRIEAEKIQIPETNAEQQHQVLERRATFMLQAQTEYFNTMRYSLAEWAAPAGYQIGAMYDLLYQDISKSPVPPPKLEFSAAEMAVYEEEYRKELRKKIAPLVKHAVRYWELTMMMLERTGIESEWKDKIQAGLDRVREQSLHDQMPGAQPLDTPPRNLPKEPPPATPKDPSREPATVGDET